MNGKCEICRDRVATQVINCPAVAERDIHVCPQCLRLLVVNEYDFDRRCPELVEKNLK
jgi:hypothetical protein